MTKSKVVRTLNLVFVSFLHFSFVSLFEPRFPARAMIPLAFIFLRGRAVKGLAVVSCFFLVVAPRYLLIRNRSDFDDFLVPERWEILGEASNYERLASMFLNLFVALIFLLAVKYFWKYLFQSFKVMWGLFLAVVLVALYVPKISMNPLLAMGLLALAALVSRGMTSALYFRHNCPEASLRLRDAIWILPFWHLDIPNWDTRRPKEEMESADIDQLGLFKKLCGLLLVLLVVATVRWIAKAQQGLDLGELYDSGGLFFNAAGTPLWKKWISVLLWGFEFIFLRLWFVGNLTVFFLNIVGIETPDAFARPWRAVSFADAYSRAYVYYSKTLTALMYIPIYRKLRKNSFLGEYSRLTSLFFAIFGFSVFYHLSRDIGIFMGDRELRVGYYVVDYMIFSTLLSTAICSSIVFEQNLKWRHLTAWVRAPLYFVLFSLIVLFARSGRSPDVNFRMFLSLFGIG